MLLLLHGTEILTFLGGTFLGLGIFVCMLIWALRGPIRTWTIPIAYLVVALSVCIPEILTDNFFGLAIMFAFPWSVVLVVVSTVFDQSIALFWNIPCIVVNAGLIYLIARYQSH